MESFMSNGSYHDPHELVLDTTDYYRDVSGVTLSTGKLQGVVTSAIDPLRASA